jgi:ABC-type phosphate transport system substrate-binding protein
MRNKLIVAAATAAALGTLGLTATAQAQPAKPARISAIAVKERVTVGIPAAFTLKDSTATSTCTWKVTGLPTSVTSGKGLTNNCTDLIDGVWPVSGNKTVTATAVSGGVTTTFTVTVTVLAKPCENDATGVGSDTITPVTDQLATDYNKTLPFSTTCSKTVSTSTTHEQSWDAVNPITGAIGDSIAEKTDCSNIARPDGSGAGITQLGTFTKSSSGPLCTNFARSSRAHGTSDPPFAPGGVAFAALAGDAVSWVAPAVNTSAPASLTPAQLTQIWSCSVPQANNGTGPNQWGDLNAALTGSAATTPIVPFLPQSGSGTLSFWETAIGVTTPGPCVSNANNTLEENEGVNPVLNNPGTIFIFSVGDFIAQSQHSAKCLNTACTANSSGVVCTHVPQDNFFFCNEHGTMREGQINGVSPISGTGKKEVINPAFDHTFDRTLFDVVPFDGGTTDHIPGATSPVGGLNLEVIFGASGFDCHSATATTDIKNYGFVPLGGACGTTS